MKSGWIYVIAFENYCGSMTGETSRGLASCCRQLLSCKGVLFEVLAFVVLALCASIPYANSLDGKFAYDDKVRVFAASSFSVLVWATLL